MALSPRRSLLSPKAGAAFFALRRRLRAAVFIGSARIVFSILMVAIITAALSAFIFSVFLLGALLSGPAHALNVFPHWAIGFWIFSCGFSFVARCSTQFRARSSRVFFSQFFSRDLWGAISDDKRLTPVAFFDVADAGRASFNLLWDSPRSFAKTDALTLLWATPLVAAGIVSISGFLVSNAVVFWLKFLPVCVDCARNGLDGLFGPAKKATALASAAQSPRLSLVVRFRDLCKSAIGGAIDSLAQEGGEELARREREALSLDVERAQRGTNASCAEPARNDSAPANGVPSRKRL